MDKCLYQPIILFLLCFILLSDALEPIASTLSVLGAAYVAGDAWQCYSFEFCRDSCVRSNVPMLERALKLDLIGQHIASRVLPRVVANHVYNHNPGKALVLSLHGCTGCGKNYASDIIVNHLYRNRVKSKYVKKIVATDDFTHTRDYNNIEKIGEYRKQIKDLVRQTTKACGKSLFIFDEADKLPEGVLDVLKPFLDFHEQVGGVDYRKNIFIFLSNRPGDIILNTTSQQYEKKQKRTDIGVKYMEQKLRDYALNNAGGLKNSAIIKDNLIDFFVSYLPMERHHVVECALAEMRKRGRREDQDIAELAADQLSYEGQFSTSGCKQISKKLDMYLPPLAEE